MAPAADHAEHGGRGVLHALVRLQPRELHDIQTGRQLGILQAVHGHGRETRSQVYSVSFAAIPPPRQPAGMVFDSQQSGAAPN